MKRTVRVILAAMLVMVFCGFAMAEKVYVTISTGSGELALTYAEVDVSDLDGDGIVSINDALAAAHDAHFDGGAAAGYASENTEYGISMYRLWGEENGGSYGYYVNNACPMSLLDPIHEGDHAYAYAYQDLDSWSDTYCYFQSGSAETAAGESITLSLTALLLDADWNLTPSKVEGAIITISGEDSELITDADGSCTISFNEPGEYVISARSESMTLVPPVCVVTVI